MPSQSSLADRDPVLSLAQPLHEDALSMRERGLHLVADEQRLRDLTQESKTDFVFDAVAYQGTADAVSSLHGKFVPMQPAPERSLHLDIGEVMIPLKFCNAGSPPPTEGKRRHPPERGRDLRADARQRRRGEQAGTWQREWRNKLEALDSRVRGWRHEARKIFGVREEEEDALQRKWNPGCELRLMRHVLAFVLVLKTAGDYPQNFLKASKMISEERPKESLP
jgi:hypothetical protein